MSSGGAAQQALPLNSASWVRSRIDVEKWLRSAAVGEKLIYAHGPELPRGETSEYVRRLYQAGLADLVQPRAPGSRSFDFTVRKLAAKSAAAEEAEDAATDAILRALKRAANLGQRCPSNVDLARAAGLATRDMAAWRITKLVKAGTIRTSVEDGPDGPWRTVTIVETKKQTLLPPGLRPIRRSVREVEA